MNQPKEATLVEFFESAARFEDHLIEEAEVALEAVHVSGRWVEVKK